MLGKVLPSSKASTPPSLSFRKVQPWTITRWRLRDSSSSQTFKRWKFYRRSLRPRIQTPSFCSRPWVEPLIARIWNNRVLTRACLHSSRSRSTSVPLLTTFQMARQISPSSSTTRRYNLWPTLSSLWRANCSISSAKRVEPSKAPCRHSCPTIKFWCRATTPCQVASYKKSSKCRSSVRRIRAKSSFRRYQRQRIEWNKIKGVLGSQTMLNNEGIWAWKRLFRSVVRSLLRFKLNRGKQDSPL